MGNKNFYVLSVIILVFIGVTVGIFKFISFFIHPTSKNAIRIIEISDTSFKPKNLTIPVGTTIVFQNVGKEKHWPASNIHPTHDIYPEFDPKKPLLPKTSWKFTFDQPGEWQFHDHLVPTMIGTITVVSSSKTLPTESRQLEPITHSLGYSIKLTLQNIYFHFYPQEKLSYVSRQDIAQLIERKDLQSLSYIISLVGPEKVIAYLFEQSGKGEKSNCHVPAHTVGRTTYRLLGESAFQKNITLCNSGYQHGVMAAYIYATGTRDLIQRLNNVCEKGSSEFARLTCFHGVGHGLMGYYNNDLPTAINRCISLGSPSKQNNCMVGVFMENLGAYFGDSITDHPTTWLRTTDMHFPCNAIDQTTKVQRMCYAIQTHWMRIHYKNNFSRMIDTCLEAPLEAQVSCFSGIGQEAALYADRNPKKIIAECNKVPDISSYKEQCFLGGLGVILDYWGNDIKDQGNVFCSTLDHKYQFNCETKVENRLQDLKLAKN